MEQKEFYDIAKDAVNDAELHSADIPSIDLYVDQISNLIAEKLLEGSERFRDRQLTKTMINNYSKDGLITPVKGKKYNKEQIIQMLMVYTLKNTLSIGEIKRLINGAYAIEGFDGRRLTALYDRHLTIKEDDREYAMQTLESLVERNGLDLSVDEDYITAIGALTSFSAQLKNMAQALIDARFPEPEPEESEKEKEKREKEEKKEKEKEEKKEKKKKKEEE